MSMASVQLAGAKRDALLLSFKDAKVGSGPGGGPGCWQWVGGQAGQGCSWRAMVLTCCPQLSVVEYDPGTHDLKTLSLHYFEEPELRVGTGCTPTPSCPSPSLPQPLPPPSASLEVSHLTVACLTALHPQDGFVQNVHTPRVRVDPDGRCAAMLIYGTRLVVLPFRRESLAEEHEGLMGEG